MELPKRIGRPPNPEAVRKRKNQTFRIRSTTLSKLIKASNESQSSVSEEIERRVERSFEEDEASGGTHTKALLRFIGSTVALVEQYYRGENWRDNPSVAAASRAAIDETLDGFMKSAPAIRSGLLSSLNVTQHAEDQKFGQAFALQLRRKRLLHQASKADLDQTAIRAEIADIGVRLRDLATAQPLLDPSTLDLEALGEMLGVAPGDDPIAALEAKLTAAKATAARHADHPELATMTDAELDQRIAAASPPVPSPKRTRKAKA